MKKQTFTYYIGRGIGTLLQVIIPLIIIMIMAIEAIPSLDADLSLLDFYMSVLIGPVLLYLICNIFSIIMHELGHLIMGLKSKMLFEEFNFLIFSIFKENGKLKFKVKGLLGGVGGFCSMDFPDELEVVQLKKYFFGGIISNVILTFVGLVLLFIANNEILTLVSLFLIFINSGNVILNITPFETKSGFMSDGMRLYMVKNDKTYLNGLKRYQKIIKLLKSGVALEDVPEQLIYKPKELNFMLDIQIMIIYIGKLICLKKYNEAEELINQCITNEKLSNIDICRLKINLIGIYVETNRFELLKNVYDVNIYIVLFSQSKHDPSLEPLLLLYYLINNEVKEIEKSNNKIKEYFNKNRNDSYEVKNALETYNLIKEHYKF